ncbi:MULTISPECIES: VOC family protein [Streptomyces]|uniref:VOC family protein n=1 Tax=Streptomyces TaxID=1883 RepID=UPI000369291E|nr:MULTISPECIES: VOC family protein [unclassified Streptomyces]MYS32535.1 VOC family protein [Streptomyces sp. SID4920]MYX67241.1 VOC family protein [Streptomyces sp. SID8373]
MELTVQLTIDCADPRRMVAFWAEALGYVPEPAPDGHATWRAYWEDMGVPAEELPPGAGDMPESVVDPTGRGPRVWFQCVPEPKAVKNRWHFDLKVGGGRAVPLEVRKERVDATVRRLVEAGATVARIREVPDMQFYAAAMLDPEGNEFDVV